MIVTPCTQKTILSPIRRLRVRSPSGAQNRFLSTGRDDHSSLLRFCSIVRRNSWSVRADVMVSDWMYFSERERDRQTEGQIDVSVYVCLGGDRLVVSPLMQHYQILKENNQVGQLAFLSTFISIILVPSNT